MTPSAASGHRRTHIVILPSPPSSSAAKAGYVQRVYNSSILTAVTASFSVGSVFRGGATNPIFHLGRCGVHETVSGVSRKSNDHLGARYGNENGPGAGGPTLPVISARLSGNGSISYHYGMVTHGSLGTRAEGTPDKHIPPQCQSCKKLERRSRHPRRVQVWD